MAGEKNSTNKLNGLSKVKPFNAKYLFSSAPNRLRNTASTQRLTPVQSIVYDTYTIAPSVL